MGDIGNAAAGGMNMLGTIYAAERNLQGVRDTNDANLQVHREDNQFNASESALTRGYNTSERLASQDFNAQQADLNRQFQSSEADKARQFQIESIGKTADAYQRLGINPAGSISGFASSGSSPSGSMASSSPASASPASASPFSGFMAPHFENPIASFIEAFQGAQANQAKVQGQRLLNENQKVANQFQVRKEILGLRQRNAEINHLMTLDSESRENKAKLASERKYNELQIDILENGLNDFKAMNHEQRVQAEYNTKILVEKHAQEVLNTQWMPRLLSSQYNLTDAQARSCLEIASAAMKDALTAEYNSKTGRMQLDFDKAKWNGAVHRLVNAQIDNLNQSTETLESQENLNVRNTKAVSEHQILDVLNQSFGMIQHSLTSAATMLGGSLFIKGVSSKAAQSEYNSYTNMMRNNPNTTSTSFFIK